MRELVSTKKPQIQKNTNGCLVSLRTSLLAGPRVNIVSIAIMLKITGNIGVVIRMGLEVSLLMTHNTATVPKVNVNTTIQSLILTPIPPLYYSIFDTCTKHTHCNEKSLYNQGFFRLIIILNLFFAGYFTQNSRKYHFFIIS